MIEFRRGVPGDGALIAATRQKYWATTYRGIFPDEAIDSFDYAWHAARDEKRLIAPRFFYELILDGEKCVGYFSYGEVKGGAYGDFCFRLQSTYLLKEYRGRAIGKRMMDPVFDACRGAGFFQAFLGMQSSQ